MRSRVGGKAERPDGEDTPSPGAASSASVLPLAVPAFDVIAAETRTERLTRGNETALLGTQNVFQESRRSERG